MSKIGRVLSIRLSNTTLLGCFDVCEIYDLPSGNGLSTAVVAVVEFYLEQLKRQNRLPLYNSESEAGEILADKSATGKSWKAKTSAKQRVPQGDRFTTLAGVQTGRIQQTRANFEEVPRTYLPCRPNPTSEDFSPESFDESDLLREQNETADEIERELNGLNDSDLVELNFPEENLDFDSSLYEDENAAFDALIASEIDKLKEQETEDLLSKILVTNENVRKTDVSLVQNVHHDKVRLFPENEDLRKDKFYKNAQDETMRKAIRMVYDALPLFEWSTEKAQRLIEQTIIGLTKS